MKPFVWTCATITCNHISEAGPPIETIRFLVIFAAKINFSGHTFWKNYFMKVLFIQTFLTYFSINCFQSLQKAEHFHLVSVDKISENDRRSSYI